jgi:polysaccharide deacetylase family protein (PEP-CTERM system associated)
MKNAMTVDLEDYFHVAAFANVIQRSAWDHMEYRVEANTHRLLNLFAERGVHATFFVLGWVAKRSPQLIRDIQLAGHEVASHGMSHKLVFNQTREEFYSETRDSKKLLEDILGASVNGYRASTYSITRKSLWALDVLCDLGFRYDSSIFPIKHDVYGIPDAPQAPTMIRAPEGGTIVEFPMSTARMLGLRIPVSGGGYFRLLPYLVTHAGLLKINRELKRPFVFYLHPWEIDSQQPRVRASVLSRFRHYTNIDSCEAKLTRLIGDFQFCPMNEALGDLGLLRDSHISSESAPIYAFAS